MLGEVVVAPVRGNHDRTHSVAVAMAVKQRFHETEGLYAIEERQYGTCGAHLICITHVDYSKKKMRNIGDGIRSEARTEYGRPENTSLLTGHLHHKAMDMEDQSGRVHYQAPSPVPLDKHHNKQAYVGSRRGVQFLDWDGSGDRLTDT